jgi:carotenoid 1,2-hydratase
VGPDGYAWWYLDGISDDGSRAVSVIAFVGSVFSPWYRWSGRRDPWNHVCLNVVTYGPGGRFTMTDRGRAAVDVSEHRFGIGPSAMSWDGARLVVEVDEIASPPLVGRMRGTITFTPTGLTEAELSLTPDGAHIWRPYAPIGRIAVDLGARGRWQGHGYFDHNRGSRALEADFSFWTWGRYPHRGGASLFYDAVRRDGSALGAALHVRPDGRVEPLDAPPPVPFRRSLWAVRRETRADPGHRPRQVLAMLDAPFYCRSVVETRLGGEVVQGVHEALDLDRFRGPWLMPMLAMRVPRRRGWG